MTEVSRIVHGKYTGDRKNLIIKGVSTDSRNIKNGELFIPLIGKEHDGHKYIGLALKAGASASLSSKKLNGTVHKNIIYVKDTLKAFHDIAKDHRQKFNIPLVGITGSSGKTTTKDMIASILSRSGKTLKTEENYNNEIGVPKNLLKLTKSHKFAVIEMAMQGLKEIELLAEISRPDVAVITNIGSAHMEHLKTQMNVAKAKSEILKFLKRNDTAVLPADDDFFFFLKKRTKAKILSFGLKRNADIHAANLICKEKCSCFTLHTKKYNMRIELPLPGRHNIYDAVAAAAAAYALNIPPARIKSGLEKFKLSGKRLNMIRRNNLTVINDTYNANPESMAASLDILENFPPRRIAVLGDMLELGPIAKKSHVKIGEIAANLDIEALITVGKLGKYIAQSARNNGITNVHHASTNKEAIRILKRIMKKNDTLLIKGSRGMRMEEIVRGIC